MAASLRRLIGLALSLAPLPAAAASDFPASLDKAVITEWLVANTAMAPSAVVSVGGGRVVALVGKRPATEALSIVRITIWTEIITPEAAREAAALSETQDIQVDCAARTAKIGEMRQYSGRNLSGSLRTVAGWAEWSGAASGTILARMIDSACSGVAADIVPAPPAAPILSAKPPPVPSAPSAPAAPSPAPSPAASPASAAVQISASSSARDAEASIAQFRRAFPALVEGRPMTVEQVVVSGRTYHRALVDGFADAKAAAGFCQGLKASGRDCIVRRR